MYLCTFVPVYLPTHQVRYERVHAMPGGLAELRPRLGGSRNPSRRAFAFVHPLMPLEPLVFVQASKWSVVSGEWSVVSGQWSVVSGEG